MYLQKLSLSISLFLYQAILKPITFLTYFLFISLFSHSFLPISLFSTSSSWNQTNYNVKIISRDAKQYIIWRKEVEENTRQWMSKLTN